MNTGDPVLRVKNWRKFQHYSDRNPPWIKLHFEILSSRDWVTLDDASRVLAIACMLIASRNEGVIPADSDYVQRVAYLKKPPNFKPLIACGFLEVASDCKQMLASARPETETETETEDAIASFVPGLDPRAWEAWVAYRQAIRKPLNRKTFPIAQKQMAALGQSQMAAVEHSIANNYRGLFPPSANGKQPPKGDRFANAI
jgi:hypothetical protein